MADLARNHTDRQIWITRSHLAALGITTLFIAILSFFIGLKMGQNQAGPATAATPPPLLPDPEKEDALEELLRQVEDSQALVSADLSFPSALSQGSAELMQCPRTGGLTEPLRCPRRLGARRATLRMVEHRRWTRITLPNQTKWIGKGPLRLAL